MRNLNFFLTGMLIGLLISTAISKPANIHNDEAILGVYHLGRIEGKTFYIDRPGTLRNWTEAMDFCAQGNLRLASITTSRQENFLRDALGNLTDIGTVSWTAGRTTRTLSQFVWEYAPNSTISSSLGLFYGVPEHLTCLAFVHVRYWDAWICSNKLGTLCESIE